jgi:enamine deaminase RidA (YjgF/YER057c/UK114 family)
MRMSSPDPGAPIVVHPEGWPRPSGYSQALRVPAGRELLFVSGQVGWDSREQLVGPGFVEQFEQALRNCVAVVEAAGGSAGDIVRLTMYCCDRQTYLDSRRELGAVWKAVMGRHYPSMTMVQVAGLVEDGAQIEIEATAAVAPAERAPR